MKPLNLAIVSETYAPEINGVAMTVGRLVDGLRRNGHQVTVVRPRQHGADRGGAGELALPGLPLPGYSGRQFGLRFGLPAQGRLKAAWRAARPDVVHVVTEGPLGWSAVAAARALGIPATSGFHTNFDRYSVHYGMSWLRPAVAAYLRAFHRRTRATLVPTAALAATLAGEGIPGVRVVGRGVDTALFDPARRSRALRQSWGVGDDELAVIYVGRLAAEKNLDLVLRAFAAIRQRRPAARLVLVGDGPLRARLDGGAEAPCFAGQRTGEDLAAHYASADLFLFPSLSETFGNVTQEALASGLGVAAYRSAAAAELIVDGENGRAVAPGDADAFVRAAVELALDDTGRRRLARRARETALPRGWPAVIGSFEAVMREMIGGASPVDG